MRTPPAAGEGFAWDQLPALFPELGNSTRWLPLLQAHARMIAEAAERTRVTAVGPAVAVRRHYTESLEILRLADRAGWEGPLCDVGSGGGFPGLVIAAARPAMEIHLVEPLQKRAVLLERMAAALGLTQVAVHKVRAEEAGRSSLRGHCGLVTARAVAELRELLEYTAPLARTGGLLALPKGSSRAVEARGAEPAAAALGVAEAGQAPMRPEVSEHVGVVFYRKVSETPERFPRRAGVPHRHPL